MRATGAHFDQVWVLWLRCFTTFVWLRFCCCAGVRSFAFSFQPDLCTERNLHSQQAANFPEAVALAATWLSAPEFVWSMSQVSTNITLSTLQ